jgi:hypothetical protein
VRRTKLVGDEAGTKGLLDGWDLNNPIDLPDCVYEVGKKFGEWIAGRQGAWYSGKWADHAVLCRWHVYQVINYVKWRNSKDILDNLDCLF